MIPLYPTEPAGQALWTQGLAWWAAVVYATPCRGAWRVVRPALILVASALLFGARGAAAFGAAASLVAGVLLFDGGRRFGPALRSTLELAALLAAVGGSGVALSLAGLGGVSAPLLQTSFTARELTAVAGSLATLIWAMGAGGSLVGALLIRLDLHPRWVLSHTGDELSPLGGARPLELAEARSRLIGMLERLIIILLMGAGKAEALPFLVAAKALVRARPLREDDPLLADYFLVGTLASAALAILAGLVVRGLYLGFWLRG